MRKKMSLKEPVLTHVEQLQKIVQQLKYNPRSENYLQDTVNFISECKKQMIPIDAIEYFIINFSSNKGIMKTDK